MELVFKKIAAPLVLASFLMVTFFAFVAMSYGSDGRMQGDCPFSVTGVSLCPQNALSGAIHHLSSYQSFISVPMNPDIITVFIIALLLVIATVLVFFHPPVYHLPLFVPYRSSPFTSYDRKIKRWLSLFELSPSR